jgi:S1-C subfamily serine protease
MPGGGALTIGTVDPGSLGEQAGLETGDVLVGLNGKPAESYDMKALGALFRGSTPLHFEVMRNGEKRMLEIP